MPLIISSEFLKKIRTFINKPQRIQENSIQMISISEICKQKHN